MGFLDKLPFFQSGTPVEDRVEELENELKDLRSDTRRNRDKIEKTDKDFRQSYRRFIEVIEEMDGRTEEIKEELHRVEREKMDVETYELLEQQKEHLEEEDEKESTLERSTEQLSKKEQIVKNILEGLRNDKTKTEIRDECIQSGLSSQSWFYEVWNDLRKKQYVTKDQKPTTHYEDVVEIMRKDEL